MINNVPTLDQIEKMLDDDDLDGAAAALNRLEEVIKAAQAPDDEMDDDCEDDELDEDEEDDGIEKRDDLMDAMTEGHQNMRPAQVSTHDLAFDRTIAMIAARDGVPQTVALQRARAEQPAEFVAWQRLHAPLYGKPWYKSAPAAPLTWEDAVQTEVLKGCDNQCVAEQRVQNKYGNQLPRASISKGDSLIVEFMRACDECMQSNPGVSRTQAMEMVRKSDPEAFEVFQIVV